MAETHREPFAGRYQRWNVVTVTKIPRIEGCSRFGRRFVFEFQCGPIPNDDGIREWARQICADLHDAIPTRKLTIPISTKRLPQTDWVIFHAANQLRVIIL